MTLNINFTDISLFLVCQRALWFHLISNVEINILVVITEEIKIHVGSYQKVLSVLMAFKAREKEIRGKGATSCVSGSSVISMAKTKTKPRNIKA